MAQRISPDRWAAVDRLGGRPVAAPCDRAFYCRPCPMDEDDADTGLQPVHRFLRLIRNTPFYCALGDPLEPLTRQEAVTYAAALGFPDAYPALLPDWTEAADAAENVDTDSPAWEAEEQLRRSLALEAEAQFDPRLLEVTLMRVAQEAHAVLTPLVSETAAIKGITDDQFIQAATGAGVQACHQAALVLATGQGDSHPFSLRFALFEAGRWPIGIIGTSFNIF